MGWNRDQYDKKKSYCKFHKHSGGGSWVKRTPKSAKHIASLGSAKDMSKGEQSELLESLIDYVKEKEGL